MTPSGGEAKYLSDHPRTVYVLWRKGFKGFRDCSKELLPDPSSCCWFSSFSSCSFFIIEILSSVVFVVSRLLSSQAISVRPYSEKSHNCIMFLLLINYQYWFFDPWVKWFSKRWHCILPNNNFILVFFQANFFLPTSVYPWVKIRNKIPITC